jgi:GlpG protein
MKTAKPYSSVSIVLIALCALVALISNLGESRSALQLLFISDPRSQGLSDIFNGQVWRLFTPIFIHFGIMHFVFNMMWIWDLGKLIEAKKGAKFYILFVLVVAALSNLAQYVFVHSPFFGGMSGVVYGLFGYIWIRGRYDPKFSADLHKTTVNMMLIWFLLCWTGLLGPIANWAHTAGLLIGAAWAYLGGRAVSEAGSQPLSARPQRLEYLSMSDMLQLEEQRRWVREHSQLESQHQFASVAGKLAIIQAILMQFAEGGGREPDLRALDTVFCDALVLATGAQWAVLNDEEKRVPVLIKEGASMMVYPAAAISEHGTQNSSISVQQLFEHAVNKMGRQTQVSA